VRKDVIPQFEPRVTGWFGNESPFAFTMPAQSYADNAWRYMGGTPAVAALYQSRAGQTIVGEIGARFLDAHLVVARIDFDQRRAGIDQLVVHHAHAQHRPADARRNRRHVRIHLRIVSLFM